MTVAQHHIDQIATLSSRLYGLNYEDAVETGGWPVEFGLFAATDTLKAILESVDDADDRATIERALTKLDSFQRQLDDLNDAISDVCGVVADEVEAY